MKEVAIIGAGQLGSRHLQGVLKSKLKFNVTVVDPVAVSLAVAEKRSSEIPHQHEVRYFSVLTDLPIKLDLVIVATNANVRLNVLLDLLDHAQVGTLVLEKVLFQRVADYETALKAITEKQVSCYVNHPRRMLMMYQNLKKIIQEFDQELLTINAYGANWGLGCNGLHISDIISYLLNDTVAYYKNEKLDNALLDSKRAGFKEFSGSIEGATSRGHRFTISSVATTDNRPTPISITLFSPSVRIYIAEGSLPQVAMTRMSPQPHTDFIEQETMRFQSDLSEELVEGALSHNKIHLPNYEEAMTNHVLFIESLNTHIERITQEKTEICPIT